MTANMVQTVRTKCSTFERNSHTSLFNAFHLNLTIIDSFCKLFIVKPSVIQFLSSYYCYYYLILLLFLNFLHFFYMFSIVDVF